MPPLFVCLGVLMDYFTWILLALLLLERGISVWQARGAAQERKELASHLHAPPLHGYSEPTSTREGYDDFASTTTLPINPQVMPPVDREEADTFSSFPPPDLAAGQVALRKLLGEE